MRSFAATMIALAITGLIKGHFATVWQPDILKAGDPDLSADDIAAVIEKVEARRSELMAARDQDPPCTGRYG